MIMKNVYFQNNLSSTSVQPQFTIGSQQHNAGTKRVNKTAISADDDKRIILKDKITTMAIGHWRTSNWCFSLGVNLGLSVSFSYTC